MRYILKLEGSGHSPFFFLSAVDGQALREAAVRRVRRYLTVGTTEVVGRGSIYVTRVRCTSLGFDIRQLTDVSICNLQQHLSRNHLRLPGGWLAPSPYTCTHAFGHAGQASR